MKSRFTLIELLVVIAIIAILASLLMPSLNKARSSALLTKCNANYKQIYLGLLLYQDDFKGLPTTESYNEGVQAKFKHYADGTKAFDPGADGRIGGKAGNLYGKIWHCPANRPKFSGNPDIGYGANTFFFNYNRSKTLDRVSLPKYQFLFGESSFNYKNLLKIPPPPYPVFTAGNAAPFHADVKKCNVLLSDGHFEMVSLDYIWYTGSTDVMNKKPWNGYGDSSVVFDGWR